jgi:AraC family transcriptional regulator
MICEPMARSAAPLDLAPGEFFGGARLGRSGGGIEVSHRIAAGAPEQVVTHTHHDAHFILVTGGDYVSAAGRPRGAGPVLIYNPPGTTHRDHFERGHGSFFAISLAPGYAARALCGTSVPDAPRYLTAAAQHTLAMRIGAACSGEVAALSLDALCMELLGTMDAGLRRPPASPPGWLAAAVELLHDRYRDELTIAEIAAAVGVHPIHLARTFRRHLHCTPGEFARFRRLEQAAALLLRTGRPLAEVALSSGFADQSHLSRVFARYFGLPPGEYRTLAGSAAGALRRFQTDKTCAAL